MTGPKVYSAYRYFLVFNQKSNNFFETPCRFYENLQIPKYNLEYSKKRFSYIALKAWNEIPMNIRELSTLI